MGVQFNKQPMVLDFWWSTGKKYVVFLIRKFSSLYTFEVGTNEQGPSGRSGSTSWAYNDILYLFGGQGEGNASIFSRYLDF